VTLAIFYKPLVLAMWYGVAHLLDNEGWMLHHNIFTDTLIFAVMALFAVWFAFAVVVALPVKVCFFYFELALFVPLFTYILTTFTIFELALFTNIELIPAARGRDNLAKMTEEERDEYAAAKLLFKRLAMYTLIASYVYAMVLWPFYLGKSYTSVVTSTGDMLGISLSFWTPEWWSIGFNWLDWSNLEVSVRISFAVSIGAIGAEQGIFFWNYVYYRACGPRGSNAYGGWTLGKARYAALPSEKEEKDLESGRCCDFGYGVSVDAEDGSIQATGAVTLTSGGEQTSIDGTVTLKTGGEEGEGEGGEEGEGESAGEGTDKAAEDAEEEEGAAQGAGTKEESKPSRIIGPPRMSSQSRNIGGADSLAPNMPVRRTHSRT
jgi:hypothetical protein